MRTIYKALAYAAIAGSALALAAPANAVYENGQLVMIIIFPDGTIVY